MKRLLLVAPHFPPSNLAGVHRSRLFAQHLPDFGWEPIVVSVHPDYYEEHLDPYLEELLPNWLRVEHVRALPTRPFRLIGDIGIRGFLPMLQRLIAIIDREGADFILIPIPSNYAALLGPLIYHLRGIPFGIDYIDPWVYQPTGNENLKGRLSLALAQLLEPIAVRDAALITGVAEGYYRPVLERNPHLQQQVITTAMPYGGEVRDHEAVRNLGLLPTLFPSDHKKFRLVYAGAMLPHAFSPLEHFCAVIADNRSHFADVEFHFIGTGTSPDDPEGYNVQPVAARYGLDKTIIHEHPARISYLDVLAHLNAANAVFILGSTEPHYTPSKIYQGVLARKPIFALLHQTSTACTVLHNTGAGQVLEFNGEHDVERIEREFMDRFQSFLAFTENFDPDNIGNKVFEIYSAHSVAAQLATALDEAITRFNRQYRSPKE